MKKAIQFLGFIIAITLFTVACNNDPCKDVVCGAHAVCTEGTCNCVSGYHKNTTTGLCELTVTNACDTHTCDTAHHEICLSGTCICDSGFVRHPSTGMCVLPCDTITCGANQVCNNGVCDCAVGFVRDATGACVTYQSLFLGTWSGKDTCTTGNYAFTSTITAGTGDTLLMTNVDGIFTTLPTKAVYTMLNVAIPNQQPELPGNTVSISGSGVLAIATPNTIRWSYTLVDGANTDNCTCTWTKQ